MPTNIEQIACLLQCSEMDAVQFCLDAQTQGCSNASTYVILQAITFLLKNEMQPTVSDIVKLLTRLNGKDGLRNEAQMVKQVNNAHTAKQQPKETQAKHERIVKRQEGARLIEKRKALARQQAEIAATLVGCYVCGCSLRSDQFPAHLRNAHPLREVVLPQKQQTPQTNASDAHKERARQQKKIADAKRVSCTACGCSVRSDRLQKHMMNVHQQMCQLQRETALHEPHGVQQTVQASKHNTALTKDVKVATDELSKLIEASPALPFADVYRRLSPQNKSAIDQAVKRNQWSGELLSPIARTALQAAERRRKAVLQAKTVRLLHNRNYYNRSISKSDTSINPLADSEARLQTRRERDAFHSNGSGGVANPTYRRW